MAESGLTNIEIFVPPINKFVMGSFSYDTEYWDGTAVIEGEKYKAYVAHHGNGPITLIEVERYLKIKREQKEEDLVPADLVQQEYMEIDPETYLHYDSYDF